jgi:ABC-type polysaccharide/polyol phosphate export permease
MQHFFDYAIFLFPLLLALFARGKVPSWTLGIVLGVDILCVAVFLWLGFVVAPKIDQYRKSRRIRRGIAAYLRETAAGKE